MNKKNLSIFGAILGASFLAGSVLAFNAPKAARVDAAAAQTGLNLVLLGDGVAIPPVADAPWDVDQGVAMTEIAEGVYTGVFYTQGGQVILTQKGDWNTNRYYFDSLEPSELTESGEIQDYNVHQGSGDHNFYLKGNWGYFRFTLDTTKDEYPVSAKFIYPGNALSIEGDGVNGCGWVGTGNKSHIFKTDDGVIFTDEITANSAGNFRVAKYNLWWTTVAGYTELDADSPAASKFSDGGDNNLHAADNGNYVLKYDRYTNKLSIYDAANAYRIKYMNGTELIGSDVAEGGKAYAPRHYNSDNINERLVGYFTDAALTTPYDATANLNADLTLYAKYEEYSYDIYYAPGTTYNWNGVNIYAWDPYGSLTNDWPGNEMTYVGGGFYKYTFVGEQIPSGVKFSEVGNDGNQTGDVVYPNGMNAYVYEANDFTVVDNNMMMAEEMGMTLIVLTNAGCGAESFDAESWAAVKAGLATYLADQDIVNTFKNDTGVYDELNLEHDFMKEALQRYDQIVVKYHVEDFLQRVTNNGALVNNTTSNNNNAAFIMIIVVSAVALLSVTSITAIIVIKKRRLLK